MFGNYFEYLCLWSTICDNKKASCEALFLMGSVDIVLPSRDSARIANPQIDTAKIWTFLFTSQVFWWKKVKTVVTATIARFRITNAHVLHFRITNAEKRVDCKCSRTGKFVAKSSQNNILRLLTAISPQVTRRTITCIMIKAVSLSGDFQHNFSYEWHWKCER